jgi:hypothetical protein
MLRRLAILLTAIAVLAACSSTPSSQPAASSERAGSPTPTSSRLHLADDSTITYTLRDASVPPAFHRSVTVTVTKDTTHLVIDSYGDVLADKSTATPPEVWAMLDGGLPETRDITPAQVPRGCTGGTGRGLTIRSGDATVVDISAEFCGGSNTGLDTRIDAWILPARALFPSTEELAPVSQE